MSDESLTYLGSWKGRVIKAISVDGAKTWDEIRESTGLNPKSLNIVLRELFDAGVLRKVDDKEYKVEYHLYKKYREFYENAPPDEKVDVKVKFSEKLQTELIQYIDEWKNLKKIDISLKNKHFYLEERFLDDFTKELISNAKQEVLVVTPWIKDCSLSNTLRQAIKNNAIVKVITRPNKEDNDYHNLLRDEGVLIFYNKKVHAKIVTVDRTAAIISSMNFIVQSSGGQSWESGIVTVDHENVQSIVNSLLKIIELPETKSKED